MLCIIHHSQAEFEMLSIIRNYSDVIYHSTLFFQAEFEIFIHYHRGDLVYTIYFPKSILLS